VSVALGGAELEAAGLCETGRLLAEGIRAYLLNTCRLARRQRRRLRSLAAAGEWNLKRLDASPVFRAMYGGDGRGMPASEVWDRAVVDAGVGAVTAFLSGERDSENSANSHSDGAATAQRPNHWVQRTCEVCQRPLPPLLLPHLHRFVPEHCSGECG
jgi:hypothetical protein